METNKKNKRRYSPLYEKLIPIALVLLGLLVITVIVLIFMVALGISPGAV